MGFDCSNYQHQFRQRVGEGNPPLEADRHVYQTIYLNDRQKHLWTWENVDPDKIIARKWWRQFGHRWQHYLRVVPGMMFINGRNRTTYAGAWTMVVGLSVLPGCDGLADGVRICMRLRASPGWQLHIVLELHMSRLMISPRTCSQSTCLCRMECDINEGSEPFLA